MPWQQLVADVAGEYDPVTGLPAYREVVVTVPRQSGKTTQELVFMLDRALMWERPQRIAYTAQTGLDARQKVINDFWPMLRRTQYSMVIDRVLRGAAETAISFKNGSRIEVLATSEESGHGRTLDMGIMDEVFADEDDRREQAMLPAMVTRPDAQLFVYSTMGTQKSVVLNRKVEAGREAVRAGLTAGIAYFEWSAPKDADADDPAVWRACMPALGHTVAEENVRHARQTMLDGEFRRAYLNQQMVSESHWMAPELWESRRHPTGMVQPPPGTSIVLGFDGSYNHDSTALVGCTLDGHVFVVGLWERPSFAPSDWTVDRDQVSMRVEEAFKRWNVVEMPCDRSKWWRETQDWWERYGDVVMDFPQEASRMTKACAAFYAAVAEGRLTHDGNADLAHHLANAIVKESPDGARIVKDGRNSPRKIDLAIAAVMAHQQAIKSQGYDPLLSVW